MATLKQRERTVIMTGATGLLAAVVFLVVVLPALQSVRLARQQARGKQAELSRLVLLTDQRTSIEQRHQASLAASRALLVRLPRDPAVPDLVAHLDRALRISGVELRQISFGEVALPSNSTANGGLPPGIAAVTLQVQIAGDYPRLRAFVGGLEGLPRAVAIDRLALTGVQNGLVADLTLRAFFAR